MRLRPGLAVVLLALAAAGCGGDAPRDGSRIFGDTATVWSSLPLAGTAGDWARDVLRGEKLALREAGGRAGVFTVSLMSLDSTDPDRGRWSPAQVAANARRAVQDSTTIAYLGEFDSGSSAISVPILNEGGILQVSPTDTFAGLTERTGVAGEPERYYPSGIRSFARVVEAGDEQAEAVVGALADGEARRLVVVDDHEVHGRALADRVVRRLRDRPDARVVSRMRLHGERAEQVPSAVREGETDAVIYAGALRPPALGLLRRMARAAPDLAIVVAGDIALVPDLDDRLGPAADQAIIVGPVPAVDPAFRRRFRAAFGREPTPFAVLGHRAMRLVLGAIARAGEEAPNRRAVIRAGRDLGDRLRQPTRVRRLGD